MTIQVTVTNMDNREGAVIAVSQVDSENLLLHDHGTELKAGVSHDFWVHSGQSLVVSEVSQP